MLKFDQKTSSIGNLHLMPAGVLAMARIFVRSIKLGKENSTRYADCQFRIEGGEFNNRTFFSNINDPTEQRFLAPGCHEHSEKGRQMGLNAMGRMLEAAGLVRLGDANSYAAIPVTFDAVMGLLHEKLVAVKIGIEKGKGTFADKNVVAVFLSPNPDSDGYKGWQALKAGQSSEHDASLAATVQNWGGGQPAPTQPNMPSTPSRDLTQGAGWVQTPVQQPAATGAPQQQPLQQPSGRVPF